MLNLSEIFSQLLTESAESNQIIKAVKERRMINIYYESPHDAEKEGYPKGWRRIEPFCCGVNNYDNTVLRAWEVHGPSFSYPKGKPNDPLTHIPGWRMFRIDGITQLNETGSERFNAPRPKYNPDDKDMKIIYAAANFGDVQPPTQEPTSPVQPTQGQPSASTTPAPASFSDSGVTPPPTSFGNTFKSDKPADKDAEISDVDLENPEQQATDGVDKNQDKPSWFKTFGDNFKNIVNFGKQDRNKI